MTKENLDRMAARLRQLLEQQRSRDDRGTSANICMVLRRLAAESQRLDRLPAIRKLSEIFGAAPASVQRAVTELIAEDVLMARSGVGLFVKNPPPPTADPLHYTQHGRYVVRVLYWEQAESRQQMMLELIESFRSEYLGRLELRLSFTQSEEAPDLIINLPGPPRPLPLRRLGASDLDRGLLQIEPDETAPLAYYALYLFCDRPALKRLGLPEPTYRTFREQAAYLQQVAARCRETGVCLPVSTHRPAGFFGSRLPELLSTLRQGGDDTVFREECRTILEYCAAFHYARDFWEKKGITRFNQREFPILAANTGTLALTERPEELLLYPVLALDDLPLLEPLPATVRGDTGNPMECLRLLRHLQSPEAQEKFREQGFVTLSRQGRYFDPERFGRALSQAWPIHFPDPDDYYVYNHLLDHAMLMMVDDPSCLIAEWNDFINHARSYLSYRSDAADRADGGATLEGVKK